jgi:hypothetical protein
VSKFDRIDLTTVRRPCCVALVQARAELGAEGDALSCSTCGTLVFKSGRWTR